MVPLRSLWVFVLGHCCICQGMSAEKPEHLSASHTEGKGLGYSKGYSSLDLFLSQPFSNRTLVPFFDLRGHVFNDGKYAANAGLGFRMLRPCNQQIWGINAMYDYLQTSQRIYNQVGGGLELLWERWGARVNAYVPVGGKKKNIYRFAYEDFGKMTIEGDPDLGIDSLKIEGFGLKAREQFALKGIDTLFGYRFCKKSFELHVDAGPYYYWGRTSETENAFSSTRKQTFGGRLTMGISFWNHILLDTVGSYDAIFKWCGQGTITLSLPFDFTFKLKKKSSQCPESSYCLKKRLYEPVARNEIIAVDSLNRFTDDPRVLDPEFNP